MPRLGGAGREATAVSPAVSCPRPGHCTNQNSAHRPRGALVPLAHRPSCHKMGDIYMCVCVPVYAHICEIHGVRAEPAWVLVPKKPPMHLPLHTQLWPARRESGTGATCALVPAPSSLPTACWSRTRSGKQAGLKLFSRIWQQAGRQAQPLCLLSGSGGSSSARQPGRQAGRRHPAWCACLTSGIACSGQGSEGVAAVRDR